MERDYKQVELILDRILNGENCRLLKEIKGLCTAFCLGKRKQFGFIDIPVKVVHDNGLIDSAVDEAITKSKNSVGKPFLMLLQNVFRDVCRQERRAMRERSRDKIFDDTDDPARRGLEALKSKDIENSVIKAISHEYQKAVRKALANEEPTSRTIVYRRHYGDTLADIAELPKLKMKYHEVKSIYYANLASIKQQLIRFKKDFEIQ